MIKEFIDFTNGTTEMNLDSVYTKDEADARYTLVTDFNSLFSIKI